MAMKWRRLKKSTVERLRCANCDSIAMEPGPSPLGRSVTLGNGGRRF